MNANAWGGILRAVGPALAAYLVGKGVIPAGEAADFGAAIVTVGMAAWSVFTNWENKAPK